MTAAQRFNNQALQLWTQFSPVPTLAPALYPLNHFQEKLKLLILGMNPAFSVNWIQNRITADQILGPENSQLTAEAVYGWHPDQGPLHQNHLLTIESHAFENYGVFFNPQREFADKIGCADSFSHMDLFHVRQTQQNEFLNAVNAQGGLTDWGQAQINLTKATICDIRPAVVVIANATAARMAVEFLGLEFANDLNTQCSMRELPGTRFFLAGMLSGVRAMDRYSRARLEGEVRTYLESQAV